MKQPIQPLYLDKNGTVRFKENAIVSYLLYKGGLDLNDIARHDFSKEDREHFAQLIGYSHSGSGELGYMSNETWSAAWQMYEDGIDEKSARITFLEDQIDTIKRGLKIIVPAVYSMHEDDLDD